MKIIYIYKVINRMTYLEPIRTSTMESFRENISIADVRRVMGFNYASEVPVNLSYPEGVSWKPALKHFIYSKFPVKFTIFFKTVVL